MKIRRATGYALSAIFQLAEIGPNKCLATRQLATSGELPMRFLLQVLSQLAKNGLLRSYRGVEGGFALARPLRDISLLEVIEASEGPTRIHVPEMCGLSPEVRSRLLELLEDLNHQYTSFLSSTSLETLRLDRGHGEGASVGSVDVKPFRSNPGPGATLLDWSVEGDPAPDVLDEANSR